MMVTCHPKSSFISWPISVAPPSREHEQDAIQKTLNAIGVTYSHMNDEILEPSRIEAERTRRIMVSLVLSFVLNSSPLCHQPDSSISWLQKVRRRKSKGDPNTKKEESPKPVWPPVRKHHKPKAGVKAKQKQVTPEQQCVSSYFMIFRVESDGIWT